MPGTTARWCWRPCRWWARWPPPPWVPAGRAGFSCDDEGTAPKTKDAAHARETLMDAVTNVPTPANEPVRQYPPGSADRAVVEAKIKELAGEPAELTMTLGGQQRMGGGERIAVVEPHNHAHVLGHLGNATDADVTDAIGAAAAAAPAWRALSFDDRAAIFLKAADLLAGPWRATI